MELQGSDCGGNGHEECGILGPTFRCIVGDTFAGLKFGDRYFYDLGEDVNHRFSKDELDEIRKSSFSRLICDNSEVTEIQPNAFVTPSSNLNNPEGIVVPCTDIPSMDISLFQGIFSGCCDSIYLISNVGGVSGTYEISNDTVNNQTVWKNRENAIFYYSDIESWAVIEAAAIADETLIDFANEQLPFHMSLDGESTKCPTEVTGWRYRKNNQWTLATSDDVLLRCQGKNKL